METDIRVMLVDDHALVRSAVRQAITAADVERNGKGTIRQDGQFEQVCVLAYPGMPCQGVAGAVMVGVGKAGHQGAEEQLAYRVRVVCRLVGKVDRLVVQLVKLREAEYL